MWRVDAQNKLLYGGALQSWRKSESLGARGGLICGGRFRSSVAPTLANLAVASLVGRISTFPGPNFTAR